MCCKVFAELCPLGNLSDGPVANITAAKSFFGLRAKEFQHRLVSLGLNEGMLENKIKLLIGGHRHDCRNYHNLTPD